MVHSTLFLILYSARRGTSAVKAIALADAAVCLQSLSSPETGSQLTYQGAGDMGVVHLLAFFFSGCEKAAPFLSLVVERGRESCVTAVLMELRDIDGVTPLHLFAYFCSDLSLTKMVLREHPPSLAALNNDGETPLHIAEHSNSEDPATAALVRAAAAAYAASDYASLATVCGGSSPFLDREISRQATDLRAAIAICLNRPEASGAALAMLGRVQAADGAGHLLRYVLDFVGPYADPFEDEAK